MSAHSPSSVSSAANHHNHNDHHTFLFHRREWLATALALALLATLRLTTPDPYDAKVAKTAEFVETSFRNLFASEERTYGVKRTVLEHCILDEAVLCSAAKRGDDLVCARDRDGIPIDPPFVSVLSEIHGNPYECELNLEVTDTEFPSEILFNTATHEDMAIYHLWAYLIESMIRYDAMHANDERNSNTTLQKYNQIMISSFIRFLSDPNSYGSKPLTINIVQRKDHEHFYTPSSRGNQLPKDRITDAPTFQYVEKRNKYKPGDLMIRLKHVMEYYKAESAKGGIIANIDSALVIDESRFRQGYEERILPGLLKMTEPCCNEPIVEKPERIVLLFPEQDHETSSSTQKFRQVFERESVDRCMQYHYYQGTLVSDTCASAMLAGAQRVRELEYKPSSHLHVKTQHGRWCVWLALAGVCLVGLTLGVRWNQVKEGSDTGFVSSYVPLHSEHGADEQTDTDTKVTPTKNSQLDRIQLVRRARIALLAIWFGSFVAWTFFHSVHRNDWIDCSMTVLIALLLLSYLSHVMTPKTDVHTNNDMELSLVQPLA